MSILNRKPVWLTLFACFIFGLYFFLADEALEPQAKQWVSVFDNPANTSSNKEFNGLDRDNLSTRLLILGNRDPAFVNAITGALKNKADNFNVNTLLTDEEPLLYPKVLQFEAFLDSPLFCDFSEANCFQTLETNKDYIQLVIAEFQPEILDFMSLSKVTSFQSLNPFVAELSLNNLLFVYRLKASEIYFDILANKLDEASTQLAELILLNRLFFEKSDNLMHKISFSINAEKVYQPLIEKLKTKDFNKADVFAEALRPLSLAEVSINPIHIREYAKNAQLVLAGLAARKSAQRDNLFTRLWHQIVFKENMTLNSLFVDYSAIMMPIDTAKSELLLLSNKIDRTLQSKSNDVNQASLLYKISTIRNTAGYALKNVILPRQVNIYPSIAELDTRLQLLYLSLTLSRENIGEDLPLNDYTQESFSFTGNDAFTGSELCSSIAEKRICVAL